MFCKNCGTEIDDQSTVCPNCGAQQQEPQAAPQEAPQAAPQAAPQPAAPQYAQPQYAQPQYAQPAPQPAEKKVNGLGIAGFVVALISLGLGVYFCIVPIIALVLSAVAMGLRKRYTNCNGLAIAGLVISIVSVVIWAIIWIAAASLLAGFMSML